LDKPYFTNLGKIDNKGIEITTGWRDNIGRDFSYSVNGNFSVNKNNVISIGNSFDFEILHIAGDQTINRTPQVIQSVISMVMSKLGFIKRTGVKKRTLFKRCSTGRYKLCRSRSQRHYSIKTTAPTSVHRSQNIIFGVSISFTYKNFDLAIDGQGVSGNDIFVQRRTYRFADLNYETNRLMHGIKRLLKCRTLLDPSKANNYLFSDHWLEDGGYFRLRTVQLGYTFKTQQLKYIKMLRIYISGQNIKTFTNATGYSPEVPISNPTSAGADNGTYPVPAIYSFGINLTL
jgi:hypothetical protein